MYDYISPEKALSAPRWLKQNNPVYADIDINEEWLEQAVSNDEDLFGGLVEQCDTNDIHNDTDDMNSESVLPTCTQQPYSESSIDNSDSSTNQLADKDDRAWNVTPMAYPVMMMYSLLPLMYLNK